MVLVLCISSDDALIYLYKVSQRVSEILGGHEIMTHGQTDRRMDKVITIGPPPTSSGKALIISNGTGFKKITV